MGTAPSPFRPGPITAIGRQLLRVVPSRTPVPILSGPMRGLRWSIGAGLHSCWLGVYERRKQEVLCQILGPGDVLFDVGSHAGLYALLGARLVGRRGRVIAFEPVPSNAEMLRRHVELNGLNGVTVVESAVGDYTGKASFSASTTSYTGRLDSEGRLGVDIVSIDDYVAHTRAEPDVIKIDVEGAEHRVLVGAHRVLQNIRPRLLVATHSAALVEVCTAEMEVMGYSVEPIADDPGELLCLPR